MFRLPRGMSAIPPSQWLHLALRRLRMRRVAKRWPPDALPSHEDTVRAAFALKPDQLYDFLFDYWAQPTRQFFVLRNARERGEALVAAVPRLRVALLSEAEYLMSHEMDVLGSGRVNWGDPVRWRWDPVADYEWPLDSKALVAPEGGRDVKLPWTLGRFHHLVTLGRAYAISGDDRYAHEVVAQVMHWAQDNPVGHGLHWASAMEASIRVANLIWAFELILESKPAVTKDFTLTYLSLLMWHGRFIYDHREDYYPTTNHYLSNLCGLIWLGLYLQPVREAQTWLDFALAELEVELDKQVMGDGVAYEASTHYHWYDTAMLTWTVALLGLNERSHETIREQAGKMLDALAALWQPDNSLPLFGDVDSGYWLLLAGPDVRETLAFGAAVFNQPELMPAGLSVSQTCAWAGLATPEPAYDPPRYSALARAGWYVYRKPRETLAVTLGKVLPRGWGGHAHSDALSFEFRVGGRKILVDPGTYTYSRDPVARDAMRATAAHNTLQIDGIEQNDVPPGELFRVVPAVFEALYKANERQIQGELAYSQPDMTHVRRWFWDDNLGYWLIEDKVAGYGAHALCWRFHFAPGRVKASGLTAQTAESSTDNLYLYPREAPDGLTMALEDGWYAPHYGERERIAVAVYTLSAVLPVRVHWALQVR